MNLGIIVLSLMLVAGAVLTVVAIAGAPHPAYSDTYGITTTNSTNMTQQNLTAVAAPVSQFGGGLILLFGLFVVVIAGAFLFKAMGNPIGDSGWRR